MSRRRTARRLVAGYPPAWRARYGEELEDLIVHVAGDGPVGWRTRADVVGAALRERWRAVGRPRHGADPGDVARDGAITVLRGWTLFVVGGLVLRKSSEHWERMLPAGSHATAALAFAVLIAGAVVASVLILGGAALSLPALAAALRAGAWPAVRRAVGRAVALTAAVAVATVALAGWAHGLTAAQRNGHDLGYGIAFLAWAVLLVGCLAAWTVAAGRIARALDGSGLGPARAQASLGVAATVAMATIAAATLTWWITVAERSPAALVGAAPGAQTTAWPPDLVVATLAMLGGIAVSVRGVRRARGALAHLGAGGS